MICENAINSDGEQVFNCHLKVSKVRKTMCMSKKHRKQNLNAFLLQKYLAFSRTGIMFTRKLQ